MNMPVSLFFAILLLVLLITVIIVGAIVFVYRFLFQQNTERKTVMENAVPLDEIFVALEFIISTETNLYEQYLSNHGKGDIAGLSNTEFKNIYNELSMRILKSVSPSMWSMCEMYMTREAIQTYITERVFNYLLDKADN